MKRTFWVWFTAGCAGLIGGLFGGVVIGDVQDYLTSADWQQARGSVIASRVDSNRGEDGTTYLPDIEYFYYVGDRRLVNDRFNFGSRIYSNDLAGVSATVARYPPGQSITVYYNPAHPQDSVIERHLPLASVLFLSISAVGFLVALIIPLVMLVYPRLRASR